MRRWLLIAPLAAGFLVARPSGSQEARVRFPITSVHDSTFTFPRGQAEWLTAGQQGIAVDPRRQDVLIARFTVMRVARDTATAVITGQTEPVTTTLVALLDRPRTPWYKQFIFWAGVALGGAAGAIIGAH